MKIHKLAGIDIGSNSVRLLVANVIVGKDQVNFKKSSLTRLPVRLGPDAFEKGKIGKKNCKKLIKSMQAYGKIMEVHGVERYRACATSALREAANGVEIAERVYNETGINIELIDGREEAKMIFSPDMLGELHDKFKSFLYVDVGGGSTEFTLFHKGHVKASRSFKIGTIRLLRKIDKEKTWREMEGWIKECTQHLDEVLMVGSGGNINRTFKMSAQPLGTPLEIAYLEETYRKLQKYSVDERMLRFDLNPDRADVITHALRLYLSGMKWAGARHMLVPKKGLSDGIVRYLYREHFRPVSFQ